jgi:group I intron endonuclease
MIGIYKITSPSNKVYIGQSINIEKRKKQYIKLDKSCIGPKLYNSLKKYSWESHIHEILEECILENLNKQEIYYKQQFIDKFGWENALFCEIYDSGGGPKSEKTKHKQSISHKLNLAKSEIKEKRKINCKIAANRPGVQEQAVANTDWVTREINRLKSMDYSKLKKAVLQFDLDGNFIKEWDGFIDIKYELNYDQSTIRKCCKGLQKTAYRFKWVYKAEYLLRN